MSEEEGEYFDVEYLNENVTCIEDNEDNILIKQELIDLVSQLPVLYAKNWKEYAGKNCSKDLIWEKIGSNLSIPISGELHINYLYLHEWMWQWN